MSQKVLAKISEMTKVSQIKDQKTLNKLLRDSEAFNPIEGWVLATNKVFKSPSIWETRTPKPKRKGDVPRPYEFLSFATIPEQYSKIAKECRTAGFGMKIPQIDGYEYSVIAGGIIRRLIKKEENQNVA